LREEIREAVAIENAPTVLRFPKGSAENEIVAIKRLKDGVDVLFQAPSKDVLIVAVGAMASLALDAAKLLAAQGIGATVVDPRWVVPVPVSIIELARHHRLVVSIEDGIRVGGVGTRIRQDLRSAGVDTALNEVGLPDEFLEHASRAEILERVGLTPQAVAHDIVAQVLGTKLPHARAADEPVLDTSKAIKPQATEPKRH
jgi:1-deoxy-D-xylulose-5-phosphate synthase